jgi:hypothetical protein
MSNCFEQSVWIRAPLAVVDRTMTDRDLMHQWLNPLLRCEPIGNWSSEVGAQSRFIIAIPGLQPTLLSRVVERQLGLVVWEFEGFFRGRDRWECTPESDGTRLTNRFRFTIPNPVVRVGFRLAASLTRRDMVAQLQRLKAIAEAQV